MSNVAVIPSRDKILVAVTVVDGCRHMIITQEDSIGGDASITIPLSDYKVLIDAIDSIGESNA